MMTLNLTYYPMLSRRKIPVVTSPPIKMTKRPGHWFVCEPLKILTSEACRDFGRRLAQSLFRVHEWESWISALSTATSRSHLGSSGGEQCLEIVQGKVWYSGARFTGVRIEVSNLSCIQTPVHAPGPSQKLLPMQVQSANSYSREYNMDVAGMTQIERLDEIVWMSFSRFNFISLL
jgi:hypothetical protein